MDLLTVLCGEIVHLRTGLAHSTGLNTKCGMNEM